MVDVLDNDFEVVEKYGTVMLTHYHIVVLELCPKDKLATNHVSVLFLIGFDEDIHEICGVISGPMQMSHDDPRSQCIVT